MVVVDDLPLDIDAEFEIECQVIDQDYFLDLLNVDGNATEQFFEDDVLSLANMITNEDDQRVTDIPPPSSTETNISIVGYTLFCKPVIRIVIEPHYCDRINQ